MSKYDPLPEGIFIRNSDPNFLAIIYPRVPSPVFRHFLLGTRFLSKQLVFYKYHIFGPRTF